MTELFTAQGVADMLRGRATKAAVLRARREGKLRGHKIGRGWTFTKADVEAWLDAATPAPLTAPVTDLPGLSRRSRARLRHSA